MAFHYNQFEGLSEQEQRWLDELAHGLVRPESFAWILQLLQFREAAKKLPQVTFDEWFHKILIAIRNSSNTSELRMSLKTFWEAQ